MLMWCLYTFFVDDVVDVLSNPEHGYLLERRTLPWSWSCCWCSLGGFETVFQMKPSSTLTNFQQNPASSFQLWLFLLLLSILMMALMLLLMMLLLSMMLMLSVILSMVRVRAGSPGIVVNVNFVVAVKGCCCCWFCCCLSCFLTGWFCCWCFQCWCWCCCYWCCCFVSDTEHGSGWERRTLWRGVLRQGHTQQHQQTF